MKNEMWRERTIAEVVVAVDDARVSIHMASEYAEWLMEDMTEEKRYKLEVELPDAKAAIEKAIENVALLRGQL